MYSLQSVLVGRLCALGFPVGRHWCSEAKVKSCTTPQSATHTEERCAFPRWFALSGLQRIAEETWSDERGTRENKGPEGCENARGADGCEDSSWADSCLLATTSVSQRTRNTHPALKFCHHPDRLDQYFPRLLQPICIAPHLSQDLRPPGSQKHKGFEGRE